jgi:hypothetical protein
MNAFENGKTVTAVVTAGGVGLVANHAYTVMAYDTKSHSVELRNPWGKNPKFNNGSDPRFWLGKDGAALGPDGEPLNDGVFWMSLSDFTKKFAEICYQK